MGVAIDVNDIATNDCLSKNKAKGILNDMYNTFGLNSEDERETFKYKLLIHAMLNGTSDRLTFDEEVTVGDKKCNLRHIEGYLRGRIRKFFRAFQQEAYDFLTDEVNYELRRKIVDRYGADNNIYEPGHAPILVDFFKQCLSTEEKSLAKNVKQSRVHRSVERRNDQRVRPSVSTAFRQAPLNQPGNDTFNQQDAYDM